MSKVYAGGKLKSCLEAHPSFFEDATRAKKIIHDIAIGLSNLHKRNIVLHDLRMHNILMSDESPTATACIADFGLAQKLKSSTDKLQWSVGARYYMSPELISKQPYGLGRDIWSLGCLSHALLTRHYPFWNSDQDI